MLEKIVLKIAGWLLQFTSDWTICAESTYEKLCYLAQEGERVNGQMDILIKRDAKIKAQAAETAAAAARLLVEHKGLQADYDRLREDAKAVMTEELLTENEQLRRDAEAAKAAYDALLEEFAQLTEGRTW